MDNKRYIPRLLAPRLHEYLAQFPAVLLLGARQVGKTTLLQHELGDWAHLDLEDAATADVVRRDPALFLRDHPDQTWFDEAHRVPDLFPALRVAIDQDRRPGRFVLCGSASGALTHHVSESLAGRIGVLTLRPLAASEWLGRDPPTFLSRLLRCTDVAEALATLGQGRSAVSDAELRSCWFYGGFPEPVRRRSPTAWRRWFDSYVRLVSERDLVGQHGDLNPVVTRRLLRMLAARHGQTVNAAELGRDFGVRAPKVRQLIRLLEGTFLWYPLLPYFANIGKRLVKSPKGYLADSGLLHSLLGLEEPDALEVHPSLGPSWEGWVLQEIITQASLMDASPSLFFYRTQAGAEVDLVIKTHGRLIPVEIKHTSRIAPYDLRGLRSFLAAFASRAPFGIVLSRTEQPMRLTPRIVSLPFSRVI